MEFKQHVFTPSGKPRRFTDEQEVEIAKRYINGVGAPTLAREHGVSHHTIYNVLKRLGVPSRKSKPRGEFVVGGYVWSPIDFDNPVEVAMQTPNGYKYLLKHRKVMANSLGRPLTANEQVHHIDGNRGNNNISNLQLRKGAHGSGIKMICNNCGSHDVSPTKLD